MARTVFDPSYGNCKNIRSVSAKAVKIFVHSKLIWLKIILKLAFWIEKKKSFLAERSFDLRTSGLWAQHASTAPLCCCCRQGQKLKNWFLKILSELAQTCLIYEFELFKDVHVFQRIMEISFMETRVIRK